MRYAANATCRRKPTGALASNEQPRWATKKARDRMEIEVKNAIIQSAEITSDDYGVLSAWITLDDGDSCQSFGGYRLYLPKLCKHHTRLSCAGHFIWRVMEVAGVGKWSSLKGKTVRVKADHCSVHAIGHIIKEDWFCPAEDFKDVDLRYPAINRKEIIALPV